MPPERSECFLNTNFRKSISAVERLVTILRFLPIDNAQKSLTYSFRLAKLLYLSIVNKTCDTIFNSLKGTLLSPPETANEWLKISVQFEERWNMPHVITAVDGKPLRIECPKLTGSQYFD